MNATRSWKESYQLDPEPVIEVIRECVTALRARGLKTENALTDIAPELGITHRRVRSFFHRDGFPIVLKNEWMQIRYNAGMFFLNEAMRLRKLADNYEKKGRSLVIEQTELQWSETAALQKRAA